MVKKLPCIKKGLKEFILDEDAKVIDRTATRIAITTTFLAINFLANSDGVNAYGKDHQDHSNHQNNLNAPNNYGTGIHGGTNPMTANVNQIPDKSVETMHANHYNHQDQAGGQGMGLTMLVFAIAAIALVCVIGPGVGVLGAQMGAGMNSAAAIAASNSAFAASLSSGATLVAAQAAGSAAALSVAAGSAGAIAAGTAVSAAAGAAAGAAYSTMTDAGGEEGGISTGSPHFVPEPILQALADEEE